MENEKSLKDIKDVKDIVDKLKKLDEQIKNPTRFGMIDALSDAQSVAHQEITTLEYMQGDTIPMLWSEFQDRDLYRKLSQYKQALYNHAVNKFGEETVKNLLHELLNTDPQ